VSDTSVTVSADGQTLTPSDVALIRSVDVAEAMNAQTQVSMVIACNVDNASNWSTPLDALVAPFARFQVEIDRGGDSLVVPARATSASWSLQAGGLSTLTIAGLDASADLDREEHDQDWSGMSDAAIATALLTPVATPMVGTTPPPDATDRFTRHQRGTDWSFLRALATRNDFDVYLTSQNGTLFGVFDRINPNAAADTSLDLGYGTLGGTAAVQVQLVTGQKVRFTYGTDGQAGQQVAENDGTGNAMGTTSLGGAVTVLRDAKDLPGTQTPDVAARVLAERTAFGASLSVTLSAPSMPLLHARRTVTIRGLGPLVSGLWLVKSVRHTITQGGHTQALSMTRNALGDSGSGAGAAAGVAGAVSVSVSVAGAL
jgi:phage protein D